MPRFLYGKPLVLAHRCLYPGLPENKLPALQKVIAEGVDYVEVDCLYTADHRIIISHGDTVRLPTGETRPIPTLTFESVRQVNAAAYLGNKFPEFVPIPTLKEIFEVMQPSPLRAELHVRDLSQLEVEEYPRANIPDLLVQFGLARRCNINIDVIAPADYLHEFPAYRECQFSLNAYVEESLPRAKQQDRLTQIVATLVEHGFYGLDLRPVLIDQATCNLVHDHGLELQCYPTNDPAEMERLMACGCDVIQTDRPDLCMTARGRLGF